jgi:MFS family permease
MKDRKDGILSNQLILSLYVPAMILALGQSMVAPVLPSLTKSFGVGIADASLVFVAFSTGAVVATVPAGYLMDKIGRRPVIIAGPVLTAVGSFMTPLSHSFPEMLFWRFVVGVAEQLWQQSRLLVIADTAPRNQRGQQMQWMTGMLRTGQLAGPSAGGFLADHFGNSIPFAIHAALTIIAVLPSLSLIKESAPGKRGGKGGDDAAYGEQGWKPVLKYIFTFQILVFFVIQISAQLSRGGQDQGSLSLYAVYAYNMKPGDLGLLNTVAIACGIPVPFLTGYLMDRFGRRAVIAPGFGSYAIGLLIMAASAFSPSLPVIYFLVSYVIVQATAGTTGGTMQVLGSDLSPIVNRGRFFALWRLLAQLAAVVAPYGYAVIAENVSYGWGFVYMAVCALIVVVGVSRVLGDTQARMLQFEREAAEMRRAAEQKTATPATG